ncbi:MAG TPA: sodium:proton antiporter [Pyrinomonadaceae bacterium]|nr:sodium:proton antiporter [Pyrinomonadaceae bacterium]
MTLSIERIEILLLIAALVAMLARRLNIPYSIGLVFAGVGLALLPFTPHIELTKELLFTAFLPPLVFEAAIQIRWLELRRDLLIILTFATVGVVLSAVVTAAGMHYIANWSWIGAIIFGILIAATDPVSVIAMLKHAGVSGRLRLLVEAESLFNDGTAAVAFAIATAIITGQQASAFGVTKTLAVMFVGSIVCGALIGGVTVLLAGATTDHLVEITFTTIAAFGSFLVAEHFHLSGILSTLTAGLLVGNVGQLSLSEKGHAVVEDFWEYMAFAANSLIFILIGMHVAHRNYSFVWLSALIAIGVVLLGRAIAVYPLSLLFARSRWRLRLARQHILFWGGLRGALALALALAMPAEVPDRESIITVAFAVVAFSIVVQGLTVRPLIRWAGKAAAD